jgi:hypothetical protein
MSLVEKQRGMASCIWCSKLLPSRPDDRQELASPLFTFVGDSRLVDSNSTILTLTSLNRFDERIEGVSTTLHDCVRACADSHQT